MDILGLLWIIGVIWAARAAGRHLAGEYRKSRGAHVKKAEAKAAPKQLGRPKRGAAVTKHAAAFWTREALHGFPITRAGLQDGWLAHQTAMEQARARREEARTSHMEARASIAEEMPKHWARQEAALDRVGAVLDDINPDDELATKRAEKKPPSAPPQEGSPMTYPSDWTGYKTHPGDNRGTSMATDTNYTESLRLAKEVEAEADAAVNDIRWQQMANQVDTIGALMRGDTATLSDAADVADSLREQKKAMEQTRDAASAFASNLQRRHGGIKEAHDDAPVPAAEAEFYED
jgi:hypothetical protein